MPQQLPPELLIVLANSITSEAKDLVAKKIGTGLINHSYMLRESRSSRSYFLQSINTLVFPDPSRIQDNYFKIYNYLLNKPAFFLIPKPILFNNKDLLFFDHQNKPWRLFEWVKNSRTQELVTSVAQAREVAQTFAHFTLAFTKGFDPILIAEPLSHFHDLPYRFEQFRLAIDKAIPERKQRALSLIRILVNKDNYLRFFDRVKLNKKEFPLRVMHHDAKISNILFRADTGKLWGPVDLDTVMPGYYFSDLGDMVRSLAGNIQENDPDILSLEIRKEYYVAIMESYSEVMKDELTETERQYLHAAGLLMIYMQGLRFLSDYLTGDNYYMVAYPEQNFDRASNQVALLEKLEKFLLETYGFSIL